jgi:hypothetical protein
VHAELSVKPHGKVSFGKLKKTDEGIITEINVREAVCEGGEQGEL